MDRRSIKAKREEAQHMIYVLGPMTSAQFYVEGFKVGPGTRKALEQFLSELSKNGHLDRCRCARERKWIYDLTWDKARAPSYPKDAPANSRCNVGFFGPASGYTQVYKNNVR